MVYSLGVVLWLSYGFPMVFLWPCWVYRWGPWNGPLSPADAPAGRHRNGPPVLHGDHPVTPEYIMEYTIPICSMYGIFTYIWVIFRANVGKYSIHGAYGVYIWVNLITTSLRPSPGNHGFHKGNDSQMVLIQVREILYCNLSRYMGYMIPSIYGFYGMIYS